jgi:hypothetical protein
MTCQRRIGSFGSEASRHLHTGADPGFAYPLNPVVQAILHRLSSEMNPFLGGPNLVRASVRRKRLTGAGLLVIRDAYR